ncbi:MAG: hypothetical protein CFE38_04850 [Comamonadaceae bacterium PBBC1]|nr:MAG: hypothetical protein CFE38_04850 [Comamonadaceae bacterium PBBC1]
MNHLCYKTIFSKRLGTLVAVGEHACSQSKGQGASAAPGAAGAAGFFDARFVGTLALGFASVSLGWSQTLPQGAQVAQGVVSVSQSGHQMAITQSTPKAVVNWQSFDIGQNAKVTVLQPSSQSVLLNRVLSDNPTQILGQLQANGQVVLVNPKGIVVGSDGSVSASAFTASTLNISDADFMAGNMRYTRDGSTGQVINKGRIEVAPGGYVALLGASVSNEGQIIAPQGGVALGAADTVTVPLGRTGKIKLELTPASINAAVANQKDGVIVADGGQVYLQAAALGQAVASVLNSGSIDTSGGQAGVVHLLADGGQIKVDGRITANSSGQDDQGHTRKGGDIVIGRDEDTGVLAKATDVSGAKLESQRGFVETSGDHLVTREVSVKAAEWLLDPSDITISSAADSNVTGTSPADTTPNGATGTSSVVSVNTIQTAINAGTSVTIKTTNDSNTTGAGNITLANALVFNNQGATDASLNLVADNGITQNAGASITTNAASAQRVNVNLTANGNYQGNTAEHASSQGIVLSSTINTNGAVTLTGTHKNTGAGAGVQFGSGASITTPGAVTVTGTSTSGTGYGVVLNNTLIDAGTTGDISITGTSTGNHGVFNNLTYSNAYNMKLLGKNVSIHGSTSGAGSSGFLSYIGAFAGNTVTAAENLSITGIVNGEGSGKAIDHGTTSWQNLVSAYTAGGTLSITGTNASAANTSPTISMVGVQARADGDLTVSATTNNAATDAIFINSSAYFAGVPAPGYIGGASSFVSTGGNTTLKSNQGSILIQDGVPNSVTSTAITGKNVIIDNTGGTFAGGVFTAGSGVSTASGRSGVQIADSLRATDPNLASNPMLRTITATDGGQIVLSGKKASTLGSGVEIKSSAALTAANITINGENTGASGAAINISNGAARLTSTQATTLTSGGVGSGTSLVAAGNISVGTQLTVTNPAVGSISGTISGTGSLLKSGAGQLTLSAYNATTANYETNTFSGGTTISQGALVIGHGGGNYNKTAGTGAIVVGDLNTGNNNVSLLVEKGMPGNQWGYLTRDITFTNNGTGTATLGTTYGPAGETGRGWSTVNSKITLNRDVVMNDATNDRLTLDGQITGTGNITLTGTRITMGTVSGTGISANDFVGNVTISSGTVLQASAKYNLPTTTNVINNGTLRMLDGNHQSIDGLSGSGKVETTSTSGGLLTTFSVGNNNSSATYTGTIVGTSSPLNLVKNGTGTQVLAGNNNYAGTTTINAGTLQIGNGGTSGTIGTGAITDNGALVFNRSDNALVVSAKISGTGTVTQAGTGTTTLTANNDWSGSTTISAGTLQIGNGSSTGTLGTSPTVNNNGTLAFNRSDNITVDQQITGTGGLTKAGTGTLTLMDSASLNGANNYSGVTTISAGTLQVGDGGTSGHLGTGNIVDNGKLVIKRSDAVVISKTISGSGTFEQSGSGTTTLSALNTYAGATVVNQGVLSITGDYSGTSYGTPSYDIKAGAELNFDTGARSMDYRSTAFTGSGTLSKTGTGALRWGGGVANFGLSAGALIDVRAGSLVGASNANDIWTNNKASLNVATGATFQGVEGNIIVDALTGGGTVNSGFPGYAYGINVGVNNGSGTFSGLIQNSNGAAARLTKLGTGTQILTGNNTYTGTTTISAGVLQVGKGGTTGNLGTGAVIDNAALVFNRSNALTVMNDISGTGTLTQSGTGTTILTGTNTYSGTTTLSTGILQVGNGGTSGTLGTGAVVNNTHLVFNRSNALLVSGAISGTGALTQMGSGTSTLAADNTYAGTTTVSGGTLQVGNGGSTGTLGAGDVTLSNNATLSYVRSASTTIANTISGAGNVSANITGAASDLTVNSSINLTGGKANLVTDGNLLVKQGISTTNATASAVFLESGKSTAAGTATGGDIQISGSGAVTVGSGGRATYMTGSIAGSTGMGVLAGNNRYNSDETTTNYTAALGSGAYAIYREKPLVSVQVNSVTKTYDGLVFSGGTLNTTLTSGALRNGDTFSALTANASFGGTSQGSKNASATPYSISVTDTGGKNALGYGLTYNAGSLTINKANLTITANPVTKTYDGTVNATGTGTVAALAGVAGGDVVNNAGKQAFLDANAGSNKTVRASGVTIKDAANADMTGNYNITYTDNTSSLINKANLTVTANDDARFVGRTDAAGFAGVHYTGLVNGETSSVLGGTLAITRSNDSTGTAGVYTGVLSPSGLTSGNYNIAFATGTYTIVPANQLLIRNANIDAAYGSSWTYDPTAQYLDGNNDAIITLSRTGTGNSFTFSDGLGTSVNATLKAYAGTNLAGLSSSGHTVVGNYSIKDISPTVVGGNFVGAPVFAGQLNVLAKAVTPNATGVSKVYDGTTAMNNVVLGLTGQVTGDGLTISGTGSFTNKNAGTGLGYTIANMALSGADAANYYLSGNTSSLSGTDGIITPATLKLTTSNVSKTYDGTTSAMGSAVATQSTQLFGSDTVSGGTFAFTDKNAGTGNKVVQVSGVTLNDGNGGGNYIVEYVNNTTSTIHKADLAIQAVTDTKTYDGTVVSGKVLEVNNASGSTDVVTASQEFASKNALGTSGSTLQVKSGYTVKDTGGADMSGNYNISTTTAAGTIDKKNVTLDSISADHKTYDGSDQASITSGAISTGVGSETLSVSGLGTFADKHVASGKTVTVSDVATLSKTDGTGSWANYNLTTTGTLTTTANISARTLILAAATDSKTYDGTTSSSAAVLITGAQTGDTISANQVFASKHALGANNSVLKVGSFTIEDGNNGNNYVVSQNTASGTIQKANLTVTATQLEKTYDGTTTATGSGTVGTLAGQAAGESVNAAGSQAFLSKNAGQANKYVRASGVTIKDSANADVTSNYDISYIDNTSSTIHKADLVVSLADQTKVYDGTTTVTLASSAFTATGVTVGGVTESATVKSTTGTYNDKNVASAHTVTATLSGADFSSGTADVSNYNLPASVSNTSSTITKANLAVTLANQTKVYDGNANATLAAGAITATGVTVGGVTETATVTQTVGSYNSKNVASANTVTAHLAAGQFTAGTADLGNYNLPTTVSNTTSTITQAALTLTANSDTSKVYNGSEQSVSGFAITSGSLQGTDSLAVDLANITAGAKATHAGTHTSTVNDSAYTNGNYAITKVNGTLFIDQKEVSLAAAKTYDGSKTLTGTQLSITTGVGSETLGYTLATIRSKNVGDNSSNFVDAVSLSNGSNGGLVSNYKLPALSASVNNSVVLTAKALTGAIADVTTTYGTATATGAVSLSGKVGTDDVLAASTATLVSAATSTSGQIRAGSYVQTVSAGLTGADAGNYSFAGSTTPTANYVVNKLALTGAIAQGLSTYSNTLVAGAVSLTNTVSGDDVLASGVNIDTTGKTSTSGHLKAGVHTGIQTLTGLTGADKDNYTFADIKGDYKVNQLALTGTIAKGETVYGANLLTGTVNLTNKVGTDVVDASGVSIDTTGKTSTSGKLKAGEHTGIQTLSGLTGTDKDNYSFADVKGDYKVNKLALTGGIAQGESIYGSALQAGAVTLTNKVGTDVVDASGVTIDTTDKTSTSGKLKAGMHTGVQTLTGLTGADMDNYTFAAVKGDYKVNKLALTGSIAQGLTTYGDALVAGTVTLINKVGTDVVDASGVSIATTGKTSTRGKLKAGEHTGIQTLTGLTGVDMDNYTFADVKGDYTVNKLALSGTIAKGETVYGSALQAGAVTLSNKVGTDVVDASGVSIATTGKTSTSGKLKAGEHTGIQTLTGLTGADMDNYTFADVKGDYTVNKLALTGSIAQGLTTYGDALVAGTVTLSNKVGTDVVDASGVIVDTTNKTSTSGHLKAGVHTGVQTLTGLTGADTDNYTFADIKGDYKVNKLALTVASIADVSTTYATAADAGVVSFGNKQGADKVTASASIVGGTNSTSGHLKASSYKQTATAISGDDAGNYSFESFTTTDNNYVVNKLALTGAAIAGVSTTYATAANTGAVSFANVQGGDKVTASASIVGGENSSSGHLQAGSYQQTATTIGGDDSANYSFAGFTTTDNNYVVNKLALTGAAIAGVTTTYATAANTGAVSFTNVQGTDKVTASASIVETATSTSGHLKAGSYQQTATAISGDDAANYSFAGVTTTDNNYVVNKLALTGAAIAGVSTTYATAANTGAVSFTNVQGADKVTASASIVGGSNSTSGHLKAGSYQQTATAINGDDAGNYSFGGVTTTDNNYVVNKLALSGAAIAGVTTTYATAANAGAVSFTNVQGTDNVNASASIVDAVTSTSGNLKAGSYKQTATAITGDDSANYSFAGVTTTDNNYVVNKLALSGAAIAGVTTTYATAANAGAVSFTNIQGTDKVTASASIVDTATSTSGNLKAGSYKQTATAISGDDAANYSFGGFTTTDNNYVVNKLALTGAAIAGVSTTYATAADAGAVSFTNVQGADKVTASASIVGGSNSTSGQLKAGSYQQTATSISGDDATNYSFAGITTTDNNYVVNKLALTGAAIAGVTTTYATAADVGAVSFTNVQGADKVTASASIVGGSNSTSGHLKAGSYQQTATAINGEDAANYSFGGITTADNNYVVNKLALTGAAIAGVSTTYAIAANTGAVSFTNVQGTDKVTASASIVGGSNSTSGHLKAGSYQQSATAINGDDAANYSFAGVTTTDNNYVVNKLALSGAAIAGVTTTYATAADAGAVSFTNVQGTDKVTAAASIVGGSNSTSGNLKAGSYQQTATSVSGEDAANYSFGGFTTTDNNYVVNKLALNGAAIAGVATTYATAANTGTVSFTNVQGTDKVTASASIVGGSNSTSGHLKAGSYQQTATAINGDDAANYSFGGITTADNNYVVDKKSISLSGITAASKVYDASNAATVSVSGAHFNGQISSDELSVTSTGTFSDKNAAAGKTVTLVNTLGGADLGNYTITDQVTTTADISKKSITLSGITASNKTYDGNNVATVSVTSANFGGKVSGDDLSVASTGTFSDKNAAAGKTVTLVNTLGGADLGNYAITDQVTTTADISKKAITLSGITAASKTYDGNNVAAVSVTNANFGDKVSGDDLSVASTGTFSDKNAATGKTVTLVNTLGGADLGNYTITDQVSTTADISKKAITLSGITAASKTYDGSKAATVSVFDAVFNNMVVGDELKVTSTGTFSDKNAATGKTVTLANTFSGADLGNYAITDQASTTADISKKAISLNGITAASKTYDGSNVAAVSVLSAVFKDMVEGDELTVASTGKFDDKNVATGKTVTLVNTLGGADLGNYSIADQANTTADISKKAITLSGITAANKTYDGNNVAAVSVVGVVFKDMVVGDDLSVASIGTFSDKNVGESKTVTLSNTLTGADLGNYTITDQSTTTANISKKDLHISGLTAANKVYDGNTQAKVVTGAAIFDGLVQDDVVTLSATGSFDTRHVGQSKPVVISTTLDGQDVGNYNITLQSLTTANITPAPLKIKATAVRKTYDGTPLANGTGVLVGVLAGAEAGDKIDQAGVLSFTDKNAGTGKTVTVKGVRLIDGTLADVTGNYSIEYINSVEGVIDRAQASISASAMSVTYNGQTQSQSAAVLSGFVSGDDVQAGGLASGRQVGSYASALTAAGRDVGNYTITFNNAALQIGKKAASLSSLDQSVVYNGQTQSLVGTQGSGFVVGDDLIFGGLPSGRQVGQYTSALMVSGADAGNYDITYGHGKLTITPKDAWVSAQAQSVTYNGSTQIQSAPRQEGFIAGDDVVVTGAAQGRDAGSYASNLSVSGADVKNYTVRLQQADLRIQKAMLGFVGTTVSDKLADGNTVAQVKAGRITGLMGAESLNISAVTGRFADAAPGTDKAVEVVYSLSNGDHGGRASNYDWSPVVLKANITAPTVSNLVVTDSQAAKPTFSRLYFQGFGGLGGVGAAMGQVNYSIRTQPAQACTPQKLEDCICERVVDSAMEICFPADQGRQAKR